LLAVDDNIEGMATSLSALETDGAVPPCAWCWSMIMRWCEKARCSVRTGSSHRGEAASREQGLALVVERRPDVVPLDLKLSAH